MSSKVRIAIIGAGAVSDYHHVPGIRLDPRAELSRLRSERGAFGKTAPRVGPDPHDDFPTSRSPPIPNRRRRHRHAQRHPSAHALSCMAAGKHVMCEKPLGLNFDEARQMYRAAREKNVRHMTAFTYRFARRCGISNT